MNLIILYSYRGLYIFRVRNDLKPHVGDIDAAAVPCGFGRAIGNKVWRVFGAKNRGLCQILF